MGISPPMIQSYNRNTRTAVPHVKQFIVVILLGAACLALIVTAHSRASSTSRSSLIHDYVTEGPQLTALRGQLAGAVKSIINATHVLHPIWIQNTPIAMDIFITRLYGRTCVAIVSAILHPEVGTFVDLFDIRLTLRELGVYNSTATVSRGNDKWESVYVALWCGSALISTLQNTSTITAQVSSHGMQWERELEYDSDAGSWATLDGDLHNGTADTSSIYEAIEVGGLSCPTIPSIAIFTIFRPGPESGVAWLESWFSHGVSHVYLYLNALIASLSYEDVSRVNDLINAFPSRITLVEWPYSWYSGSVGPSNTQRHHASLSAYASALYRWGHRHTHMGYFDFDEYAVFGSGIDLPLLLPGTTDAEAFAGTSNFDVKVVAASGSTLAYAETSAVIYFLTQHRNFATIKLRQSPALVIFNGSTHLKEFRVRSFSDGLTLRRWPGVRKDQRTKAIISTPWGSVWAQQVCRFPPFGSSTKLLLPSVHGLHVQSALFNLDAPGVTTSQTSQGYFMHIMNLGPHISLLESRQKAWSEAATFQDAAFDAHAEMIRVKKKRG